MPFLIALLVGLIAGWLVHRVIPGEYGLVGDVVIGVAGALIGALIFHLIGLDELGLIGQVIGAALGAASSPFALRVLKKKYGL